MTELQKTREICLALGANLGDRAGALRAARSALVPFVEVTASSALYETAPAYVTDQPVFLNAALRGRTALDPHTLLFSVKDIEKELGRTPSFRYGPRAIDIDIIFYGDEIVNAPDLTIPHALMAERAFVLRPLADIASEWKHPVLCKTVSEILAVLPDANEPRRLAEAF